MSNEQNQKLREALREAATSLETISRLAGKAVYPNGDSTHMGTFADVRGYATSRASVARQALALPTAAPVGEREAFEAIVSNEAGLGSVKRWLNTEDYENARVQDYRQGWIWCLEWQARAAMAGDADGKRYRWLRDNNVGPAMIDKVCREGHTDYMSLKCDEELDAAIDQAMARGGE